MEEKYFSDILFFQRMWHEGRKDKDQDKDEDKWRRGVRGAKQAWWKLEDLGVDRQKIKMRQSALGLLEGEGLHWSPFRWAEEPFIRAKSYVLFRDLTNNTQFNITSLEAHTYQSKELCVVQRFDQQHKIQDHQSWSTHLTQEDRIETWINIHFSNT